MATETTPSLLSFMESEKHAASTVVTEAPEAPEANPEVTSAPVDVVETETEDQPESQEVADEPEQKSPAEVAYLRAFLKKANLDPTGISDDELEELVLRELRAEPVAPKQPEPVKQVKDEPPPPLPRTDVVESKVGEAPNTEKTESQRAVERLEYDARLAAMVTFDENQKAVPKDDSEEALEAAKKINAYSKARRDRVEKLVDDPIGYLMQDLRREMKAVVEEEFKGFEAKQQTAQQRAIQDRIAYEESERVAAIMRDNKARFYELGADGEPRKLLKTGEVVMTAFGREVDQEFVELKQLNPNAPDSVLMAKAIKTVEKYTSAPKPKEDTAAEAADKKKKFLSEDRKTEPLVRETQPATLSERLELGSGTSLLQAILSDPDNIDNPVVAKLRQQK
jgi:hypothetical protein